MDDGKDSVAAASSTHAIASGVAHAEDSALMEVGKLMLFSLPIEAKSVHQIDELAEAPVTARLFDGRPSACDLDPQ